MSKTNRNRPKWYDYLPTGAPITEETVWQAIADESGVDVREIADGDLVDYL